MRPREQRKSVRVKVQCQAAMKTAEASPQVDCIVSDISQTGAKILIDPSVQLPQEFTLLLSQNVKRHCKVIWRNEKQIGVRFNAA
jgi:mitochondrial fission protein ELM1